MLISAIHQHESVIGIPLPLEPPSRPYVPYVPSLLNLPPTSCTLLKFHGNFVSFLAILSLSLEIHFGENDHFLLLQLLFHKCGWLLLFWYLYVSVKFHNFLSWIDSKDFLGFLDNTNSMIFSQPVCIFILFLEHNILYLFCFVLFFSFHVGVKKLGEE